MKRLILLVEVLLTLFAVFAVSKVSSYSIISSADRYAAMQIGQKIMNSQTKVVKMTLVPKIVADSSDLSSKLGGIPYFDTNYPIIGKSNGTGVCFFAQINLAETPEIEGLPQRGLLQLFTSCNYEQNYAIARIISVTPTVVAQVENNASRILGTASPVSLHKPYVIKFETLSEFISHTNANFPVTKPTLASYSAVDHYYGISAVGDYSKLLGYPYFTGSDLRKNDKMQLLAQFLVDDRIFQFYQPLNRVISDTYITIDLIVQ